MGQNYTDNGALATLPHASAPFSVLQPGESAFTTRAGAE
jgi:hypothetical protein